MEPSSPVGGALAELEQLEGPPAILGGERAFAETLPIMRPTVPSAAEIFPQVEEILSSGQLTNGKWVRELELECARYTGAREAVAVASCTTGLMLVFRVLKLRGPVILPSFTFSATAHAVAWNGLALRFADCDPETFNLTAGAVERATDGGTAAILATDVFGNPCARRELGEVARRLGVPLIIDAAHSLGSLYAGRQLGGTALAQVFSLSPTKLVTGGEGGLVITDDADLADELRMGRNYGHGGDYDSLFPGMNARMAEINAVLALKGLERVDLYVARRNAMAGLYRRELSALPGISFQEIAPGSRSTFKDFSLLIEEQAFGLDREELAQAMEAEGIETRPYFYPPVHRQAAYAGAAEAAVSGSDPSADGLPVTEQVAASALSIPIFSHMPEEEALAVCRAVRRIHSRAPEIREALKARFP